MSIPNFAKCTHAKCHYLAHPPPISDKSLSRAPKARVKTIGVFPRFWDKYCENTCDIIRHFQIMYNETNLLFQDFRKLSMFVILRSSLRGRFHSENSWAYPLKFIFDFPRPETAVHLFPGTPRVFSGRFTEQNRFPPGTSTPAWAEILYGSVKWPENTHGYQNESVGGVSRTGNPNMKLVLPKHPGPETFSLATHKQRNFELSVQGLGPRTECIFEHHPQFVVGRPKFGSWGIYTQKKKVER